MTSFSDPVRVFRMTSAPSVRAPRPRDRRAGRHWLAVLAAVLSTAPPTPVRAQASGAGQSVAARDIDAVWNSAWTNWEAGEYVRALESLDRLLRMPGSDAYLRPAALLTGEAWKTVELTSDGRSPGWSPDGRLVAFETGDREAERIRIVAADRNRLVVELEGTGAVFSADGSVVAWLGGVPEGQPGRVMIRDLADAQDQEITTAGFTPVALAWSGDGTLYASARESNGSAATRLLALTGPGAPRTIHETTAGTSISGIRPLSDGRLLALLGRTGFALIEPASGDAATFEGTAPSASADGRWVAFIDRDGQNSRLRIVSAAGGDAITLRDGPEPIAGPALSPDGSRVAFQIMPREDWEIYVMGADGSDEIRVTRDIQHDVLPQFLSNGVLMAAMGEGRHRRSYLYDLDQAAQSVGTGEAVAGTALPGTLGRTRIFHNNTVRTVAPEYAWYGSPDGSRILIVAERDGDTVSPERGVYVTDLRAPVSREDVQERIATSLEAERALREWGSRAFEPINGEVSHVVEDVNTARIARYANDLYQFDSKHVTQPGNAKAIEYITAKLREFGYEPELQWFSPPARRGRGAPPPDRTPGQQPEIRTANIIATLPGTENPELIYAVSSHFDSNTRSPGADDNSSGTTALLEAARVMAGHPQAATIQFAFFTGEEAGLLGSREYVRRAVEAGDRIVGALNNDMVGFANDHRLDNTIRYSNDGIRDIQHAAAFLFTNLITYDARYYKSTDAQAYYDAFGDIVGGIGSYPILASPHYHQTHDVLETINQQLVAEVSRVTVATLMLLASSPARLNGLQVARSGSGFEASWEPATERGVREYVVTWGPEEDPQRETARVTEPRFSWRQPLAARTVVSVKAVGVRGLTSWDWAKTTTRDGG